ncbi:MAG TPA: FHA domain-containing protein [Planctomycetota bacterium]|jgi:predicted component of type VI protein secretion system|nr:FHA domain-containing protein [Planctomycetota bacterium]
MPRLVTLSGDRIGTEHTLSSPFVLGRAPHCSVRLEEESVSREHAKFYERDGVWSVADLNSRNGTFVNGARVTKADLRPGDEISLGRFRLRFAADPPAEAVVEEIELEEPAAPARAAPPVAAAARSMQEEARPSPLAETVSRPPLPAARAAPVVPSGPPAPATTTRSAGAAKPSPGGVRRTGSGAILLDRADAPGGALGEDLAQRGLLYRLGVFGALLLLAAGVFFAATVVVRYFAPPANPPEEESAAPADAGGTATGR